MSTDSGCVLFYTQDVVSHLTDAYKCGVANKCGGSLNCKILSGCEQQAATGSSITPNQSCDEEEQNKHKIFTYAKSGCDCQDQCEDKSGTLGHQGECFAWDFYREWKIFKI